MFSPKILFKDILIRFLAFIDISFFILQINLFLSDIMNDIGKTYKSLTKRNIIDFSKLTNKVSIIKSLINCLTFST